VSMVWFMLGSIAAGFVGYGLGRLHGFDYWEKQLCIVRGAYLAALEKSVADAEARLHEARTRNAELHSRVAAMTRHNEIKVR